MHVFQHIVINYPTQIMVGLVASVRLGCLFAMQTNNHVFPNIGFNVAFLVILL